uniref:Uncharacterized protein n=1 Tax=Solanum tuberosum TaxID=4113 RepID=M1DYU3_SOLTU
MQRRQALPNSIFAFNPPGDGRHPLHSPPPSAEHVQNPPSNPAQNPPTINLTALNPHHASVSYQAPPPPQVSIYDFSENIFTSVNSMSCHKLNEQYEVDADEFEDYDKKIMVPNLSSDSTKVTISRIQKRSE